MSDSSFWKERQAAFLTYADRFKNLTAIWGARSNSYELWWRDYPEVPSDIESMFDALAGVATAGLPEPDRIVEGQPWEIWLEFMRKTKFSHDLERDPENAAGRGRGDIENPFQVSADFCEVLAARAVKSDAAPPVNSLGAAGRWPMPDKIRLDGPVDWNAAHKICNARYALKVREINKERDKQKGAVTNNSFAGGCMGRAVERLKILEEFASRKIHERIEIYRSVADEYHCQEMVMPARVQDLRTQIQMSVKTECQSVKETSEADCLAAGDRTISQISALPALFFDAEARLLDLANAELVVLEAESSANEPIPAQPNREDALATETPAEPTEAAIQAPNSEGATDLPTLSDSTERRLAVEWDTIRDKQKLEDAALPGYDRERARLLGIPANLPPYVRELHPNPAARNVGLYPSVSAAEARFRVIESQYWSLWFSSNFGYEVYRDWLQSITREISAELASIWYGRSEATDRWFRDTCAPAIEKALAALVKQRIAQARDVESQGVRSSRRSQIGNLILDEVRAGRDNLSLPARETMDVAAPSGDAPSTETPSKTGNSTSLKWESVQISFLSDERVQITCGAETETRNYAELGFADRRGKQGKPKPNQAWVTLRAMAEQGGNIRNGAKTGTDWPKVEKRIQEIRKVLRKHFSITVDPIPFVEGTGYQARFKIGCASSFKT